MYAVCKCKWIRHLEFAYFSFFLTHLEIELMQKMLIRSYEHVTHIVKKGSKRLYSIHAL